MRVEIRESGFNPWQEIDEHQSKLSGFGASVVFVGTMRDINEAEEVSKMVLEHYPEMTEKHLRDICVQASDQWDIQDSLVLHRVGDIYPGDDIVLVAVWAMHRKEAYEANRFIMEDLKSKAPFWKKETLQNENQRWVEKNTSGY